MRVPRRFGRFFEIDPVWPGTPDQRAWARAALTYVPGGPYDQLNLAMARAVKGPGPIGSFTRKITVGFRPIGGGWGGYAMQHALWVADYNQDQVGVSTWARHEHGHQVEMYLLTPERRNLYMTAIHVIHFEREQFAWHVADWIEDDGVTNAFLYEVLLAPLSVS